MPKRQPVSNRGMGLFIAYTNAVAAREWIDEMSDEEAKVAIGKYNKYKRLILAYLADLETTNARK